MWPRLFLFTLILNTYLCPISAFEQDLEEGVKNSNFMKWMSLFDLLKDDDVEEFDTTVEIDEVGPLEQEMEVLMVDSLPLNSSRLPQEFSSQDFTPEDWQNHGQIFDP